METRTAGLIKVSYATAYTDTAASQGITGYNLIRVTSTTDCFISTEGTANVDGTTNGSTYLPAYMPEYFTVTNGTDTLSVVRVSVSGTLYITAFAPIE